MSKRTQLFNQLCQNIQAHMPEHDDGEQVIIDTPPFAYREQLTDDTQLSVNISYPERGSWVSVSLDIEQNDELVDCADFDVNLTDRTWQATVSDRLNYLLDCYTDWPIEPKPEQDITHSMPKPAQVPISHSSSTFSALEFGVPKEAEDDKYYDSDKNLIDLLLEAGYDFLLPYTPADDMRRRLYEENDTAFYDTDEDDNTIYEWDGETSINQSRPLETLIDEMRAASNYLDEPDEIFIRHKPWELLGITPHQFHSIDPDRLSTGNDVFYAFIADMSDATVREALPDAQQRINFALLHSNATNPSAFMSVQLIQYIAKIANKFTPIEALARLQHYNDYRESRYNAIQYNHRILRLAEAAGQPVQEFLEQNSTTYPYAVYDYPEFPKLSRLDDLHDKAMRAARAEEDLSESEFTQETDNSIRARVTTPEYKQFLYKGDEYSIIGVKDLADLRQEGVNLNHCVGSYGARLAEGSSLIYFARRTHNIDKSFFTAEIVDRGGAYCLNQLYGYGDSIDKDESFRKFIHVWCQAKHIKVTCAV